MKYAKRRPICAVCDGLVRIGTSMRQELNALSVRELARTLDQCEAIGLDLDSHLAAVVHYDCFPEHKAEMDRLIQCRVIDREAHLEVRDFWLMEVEEVITLTAELRKVAAIAWYGGQ